MFKFNHFIYIVIDFLYYPCPACHTWEPIFLTSQSEFKYRPENKEENKCPHKFCFSHYSWFFIFYWKPFGTTLWPLIDLLYHILLVRYFFFPDHSSAWCEVTIYHFNIGQISVNSKGTDCKGLYHNMHHLHFWQIFYTMHVIGKNISCPRSLQSL